MNRFCLTCLTLAVAVGALRLDVVAAPLDLATVDKEIAALRAKEANAKLSDQSRLKAKYDRLKLELLVCEEPDYPAKRQEMMDFLATPDGWKPVDYVSFLFDNAGYDATRQRQFATPDLLPLAEKASRGDEKARLAYFTGAVKHYERMLANEPTSLEERYSREARLKFIDQSLEDPLLAKARGTVLEAKANVLRSLGRKDEAEKLMVASAAEGDALAQRFLPLLAAAYADDAKRFYGEPDRPTLAKAAEALDRYFALEDVVQRDKSGYQKACELRAQIELDRGRPQDAVPWAERLVAARGGATNAVAATLLGDAAYATGDWNRAAAAYAAGDARLPWRVREKFARALYAAGRKEAALKQVEAAAAKASKHKRQELNHAAEKIRCELKGEAR